ncbi:ABC transporter permease [Photobacterium lipolyticum]|uniref:ABC transporter permease n=2 Tax=Photobacterium lipolyticum TaxID=266810 RepID=A0A2T3N2R9_9GAMM|nr:ABC transporter permease [Photobacterium lipolyticum]
MSIELRLAWRNLWRHKRRTWITVSAMVFSNILLVFMLSLQVGTYQMMIDNSLSLFSGHLQIQHRQYLDTPKLRYDIENPQQLAKELRTQLGTDAVASRAATFSLVSSDERSFGVQVIGVEPEYDTHTSTLSGLIKKGRYLSGNDSKELILGSTLARNLKVGVGDEITILGSGRDGSFAAGIVTVVGIFHTAMEELDRSVVQMPLGYFQSLYSSADRANYIVINTPDALALSHWKEQIQNRLADKTQLRVREWDEIQPGIRQAILADISGAVFMYGVLILLVAFSVMNTQLMSVLERTREFGTVMALGLRPGKLTRLILIETSLMAMLGLIIGIVLGMVLTFYFQHTGLSYPGMEEMSAKFNLPDRMYPNLSFISVLAGPALVMVGSILAAIYPAFRIRRMDPIEAMRSV